MKKFICVLLAAILVFAMIPACAETVKEEPGVTVYFPNWNI